MNYDDFFPPIWIGTFNDDTANRVIDQVLQEAVADPVSAITLYINSDGGTIDSLAAIVEVLDKMPNPLRTVCIGRAYSAGAYLLSYGDQRFCGKHSTVMLHEISSGTGGNVRDIQIDTKEITRVNKLWQTFVATNCGLDYATLQGRFKKVKHRDLYLDAAAAKEFGIIDHVGIPQFELKPKKPIPAKRGRKK